MGAANQPCCRADCLPAKWPTKPGYYWARWTVAAVGTHEGDQLTPSRNWELVEVWQNHIGEDDEEKFGVSVHGVRESQWLDCFLWGEFVADPR
jgi:hypothetical protein